MSSKRSLRPHQLALFNSGVALKDDNRPLVRPFLKWAGGKYRVLPRILPLLGKGRTLIEPFAGSGVVFLNATDFEDYLVCDSNRDLIALFNAIKDAPRTFLRDAKSYFDNKGTKHEKRDLYERRRQDFNESTDPYERSLLFVYLNRHCYNGLCRYNSKGMFNVPYGDYSSPYFPEFELRHFAKRAERALFRPWDFEQTLKHVCHGDVVYADPPYVPLSKTASFTAYAKGGFSLRQQKRLAKLAYVVSRKKRARIVISNHLTFGKHGTETMYRRALQPLTTFQVSRTISCDGSSRKPVMELLAVYEQNQRRLDTFR